MCQIGFKQFVITFTLKPDLFPSQAELPGFWKAPRAGGPGLWLRPVWTSPYHVETSCDSCPSSSSHFVTQYIFMSFSFLSSSSCLPPQTTATPWPVKPVAWSSPTTSSGSRSERRYRTRRVSCTRPSEWPTCCSTSLRWNVPRVTASRRSTRWVTALTLILPTMPQDTALLKGGFIWSDVNFKFELNLTDGNPLGVIWRLNQLTNGESTNLSAH